jgi:hypothetical protein
MSTVTKLYFNKACAEDIEWGMGTIAQTRGGQAVVLNKVNLASLPIDEFDTLQDLNDAIALMDMSAVLSVYNNEINIGIVADDLVLGNSSLIKLTANSIGNVNLVGTDINLGLDSLIKITADNIDIVTTVGNSIDNVDLVGEDLALGAGTNQPTDSAILNALINADIAIAQAWIAEAERLTTESYATEAKNVFVKTYVSDGDGTFTATDTTDYSSLHYSLTSGDSAAAALVSEGLADADATQTALDRTATGNDRVATGGDVNQTALDRVATGNDAATATTQAGIATTKAGEASADALIVNAYSTIDWAGFNTVDGELIVTYFDSSLSTPSIVNGDFILTY